MLTVKPRDQKQLVQDIKVIQKNNTSQVDEIKISESLNKGQSFKKPEYNYDTQLSPTDIDKSKEYSMLPEEVGYLTKFPVSGHVQAWLYIVLLPVFGLQIYTRTNANYKEYSLEATKNILQDFSIFSPAVSVLMILIVITCIYSQKTWLHYFGSFFAFLSFLIQGYILYLSLGSGINLLDVSQVLNENRVVALISSNYFYASTVSIFLFFYSFLYFLLPRYRTTYL